MAAKTGYAVATIADLKAIDETIRVNGYIRSVSAERAWYVFSEDATDSPDDINIVQPTTGSGRWFKTKAVSIASDITGLTEYIQDTIGEVGFIESTTLDVTYDDVNNTLIIDLLSESIDDRVAALLTSSDDTVIFTYDDISNTLNLQANVNSSIAIEQSGVLKGSVEIINFTGNTVNITVTGSEATVAISSPSSLDTQTLTVVSNDLAPGAFQIIPFTAFAVGTFIEVQSDFPARIRVYVQESYALADAGRGVSTELTGEHGCFLECVTTSGNLLIDLAPPAYYYTKEIGAILYLGITNTDSVNRIISTTLKTLRW